MDGDTSALLAAIEASLANGAFDVTRTTIARRPSVVGRTSEFKLRWAATRLHTFVVVAAFEPAGATRPELDRFMAEASEYASANKGGLPRGLQTGTAAVTVVLAGGGADRTWAESPHGRRFAALTFPVFVDVARREVVHPPRMLLGGIYSSHLKQIVADHVTRVVTGSAA